MQKFSRKKFLLNLTGQLPLQENTSAKSNGKSFQNKAIPAINNAKGSDISEYTGEWSQTQILHLLRRCLFGVSHSDYQYFSGLTLSQCLDVLLTQSTITPAPPVNNYNDSNYTDPDVPFGQTWINAPWSAMAQGGRTLGLKGWWVGLMLNQDRSLTEKMTLFWSNNIAIQTNSVVDARYEYKYIALMRSYALGNFKKLIKAVTIDPAMLTYLNGEDSTVLAPNENYARELQELFTVGKGPDSHYTQSDVEAAARVLTGWTDAGTAIPKTIFDPSRHDTGDKQFSSFYNNVIIKGETGANGAAETDQLINMIFYQRETARNFCRKIYRWFVYYIIDPEIEANVISPLAEILIQSNFEVKPVLRALLGSVHFFDPLIMGCHIKNPIDLLIGACRQFQVAFPPPTDIRSQYRAWWSLASILQQLGMDPLDPLNVAGWSAYYQQPTYYRQWINSNTLAVRNSTTDQLASARGLSLNYINLKFDLLGFTSQLINPAEPDQLINESTNLLSPDNFDVKQKAFLKTILLSGKKQDFYWTDAWNAYICNTANAANKSVVLNRLAQYYSYILQRPEYQLI